MILYRARRVLPISTAPIDDGVVGVEGDRIGYVGRADRAPEGQLVDLLDATLLPGLVNAHTHLDLTVMRGFFESTPFFTWIRTLTVARRDVLSETDLLDSARLGVSEGIRAGITTFADTSPADAGMIAMLEAGVRGIAYREVFGPDPAQCTEAIADLARQVDAMKRHETTLVRVGVSPHAPFSVSDELFRATAWFARAKKLRIATHVAESEDESRLVEEGRGPFAEFLGSRGIAVGVRARSPVALLEQCDVLDADPLLIHCIRVDDEDAATIGARRLGVAHCPGSNERLAHGTAPVIPLIEAGARLSLGSDSMASNDTMDMLAEAQRMRRVQQASGHGTVSAQDSVAMATIGGARALGLDDEIGTIEFGKQADLAAFASPSNGSSEDPYEQLLAATPARALMAMVAGRLLVWNGELQPPIDGLAQRVAASASRLLAWKRGPNC